jgi:hypothetical protein
MDATDWAPPCPDEALSLELSMLARCQQLDVQHPNRDPADQHGLWKRNDPSSEKETGHSEFTRHCLHSHESPVHKSLLNHLSVPTYPYPYLSIESILSTPFYTYLFVMFVYLPVISIYLSIYMSHLSLDRSIDPSVHPSIRRSVHPSIHPSI